MVQTKRPGVWHKLTPDNHTWSVTSGGEWWYSNSSNGDGNSGPCFMVRALSVSILPRLKNVGWWKEDLLREIHIHDDSSWDTWFWWNKDLKSQYFELGKVEEAYRLKAIPESHRHQSTQPPGSSTYVSLPLSQVWTESNHLEHRRCHFGGWEYLHRTKIEWYLC